ncbi:MAG TPA: tetratricopeptide repeat protein [Candidatus Aminicenantes bacterium]|nr:tetratricopeptide repeat protein [Candidatus Aminicenantes bacterium]
MDHRLSSKLAAGAAILLVTAGLALAQAGRGTARINGVVVDAQGNPVAGAKLTLVFTKSGGTTLEATTDKKGEWAVMGVGTGNWDVTVNAEGWIPVTQRIYTSQLNRNPKFSIQLQQKAEGTGIVQDEATFQMLEEGNAFFQEGKYDTALIMYQDFLAKNPGAYQVLLNIGDCHREKGEYDQAIESYNKLIEQADTDSTMGRNMGAKGLAAIGLCYLKQDDLPKAQEYFMKSIEMAPQDENLPYNVAEIYFSNSQIDDAIKYFEMAIQIKPDWPDPYLRAAYAYLNKGESAKAAEHLEKFVQLEPDTERTAQARSILDAIKK